MNDSRVRSAFSGRTAWARSLQAPLRDFLTTETGSAAVLLAAAVAALIWANADLSSYESVWRTRLSIQVGGSGISQSLRDWVNSGLMTFFFFVVGLEVRREFDVGELRERRRLALPVLAGIGGMLVPIAIYLAVNGGGHSAHGWGVAMSTDTAFALGMLALVGPRFPDRLRGFMLTIIVVDDVVALLVIAVAYSGDVSLEPLLIAAAIFALVLIALAARIRHGLVYLLLAVAAWVSLFESGVDPVVLGLAVGLITWAYPADRSELERATNLFRRFREQPTPELARSARGGLRAAVSPNARLLALYHPWTSYVIVPLFALANIGIALDGSFLSRAYSSPITLGIIFAYVLGKPVGVTAVSWLVTRLSGGRLRPPVGWAATAGGGAIAGIGFTVSVLIAALAFHGVELREAKLGVLSAALGASVLTWLVFRATALLPARTRIRALLGTSETLVDLAVPVDPERDHLRGPAEAPVTVLEYGDFECPYCGRAEPVVRELLADFGDVRYVWRHLPLSDVHPNAELAAEAAEAAAAQGAFWEMHDLLLDHQGELRPRHLHAYAQQLGLDSDRFGEDLRRHAHAPRVEEDVDSADSSGVTGTPTFFVNERRHDGAYDIDTLSAAVRAAGARAVIAP
ncbi:MAG TPA: Na+/H+ antiporter NhaA [Solirubrobacterales bacterium]|jgi:Na+/H+ antiporter NhaA|nr:Na+/H+ antiporter NhaA [Solirubrobacterales bacterium]